MTISILVVEDNDLDYQMLEHQVRESQKDCHHILNKTIKLDWADSLDNAFSKLKEKTFDLIFLDLNLNSSGSYGVETLKAFKKPDLDIPIVVMTNDLDSKVWLEASRLGAQDYLFKGETSPRSIIKTIEYAIEKHALQQKLKESNNELENFAYIASHDLSEPLRKVMTFSQILTEDLAGKLTEEDQDHFQRMQSATIRMQHLLDDLLEYSRVSNQNYHFREIDSKKALMDVLQDLEEQIKKERASIKINSISIAKDGELDYDAISNLNGLPQLDLDATQSRRALQNIISNAIKYHKKDIAPFIEINCRNDSGYFVFDFKDNGIGFEEEYKERIFRQFERLHGRNEYEGTGMGLASVKKIMERHNGEVLVSSELGKGSIFSLKFPEKQKILANSN